MKTRRKDQHFSSKLRLISGPIMNHRKRSSRIQEAGGKVEALQKLLFIWKNHRGRQGRKGDRYRQSLWGGKVAGSGREGLHTVIGREADFGVV